MHMTASSERYWFVAHTRPRCEKKLVQFCLRENLDWTLPCYDSVRRYRGKAVTFQKPLFPGYVFLQMPSISRQKVSQTQHVANLLNVPDQREFQEQLAAVLFALQNDVEIRLAPQIGEGMRVRVISGPLRGMEGHVESRYGMTTVLLRIDFIGQAAAIQMPADALEPA